MTATICVAKASDMVGEAKRNSVGVTTSTDLFGSLERFITMQKKGGVIKGREK
jgi:hypothetical protein